MAMPVKFDCAVPLTKREEEILTTVGYLVMRWNYAEWCARQILRKYVAGGSLNDPDHIALSKRMAWGIEDELRKATLPKWQGVGRPYLERLIEAYSVAREHRNHIVHGIHETGDTRGPSPAKAFLMPAMPKNGKHQLPQFVTDADLRPIAAHFHALAMFAREVMVAFDERGNRAHNSDGTPVLDPLPALILPLPSCRHVTFDF